MNIKSGIAHNICSNAVRIPRKKKKYNQMDILGKENNDCK